MNKILGYDRYNENINDKFIIQIKKDTGYGHNTRIFYVADKSIGLELTWRKENAWIFDSEEDIKSEIKNNRLLELFIGNYYKIVSYSEAKNY
jgi:hypothetical protein